MESALTQRRSARAAAQQHKHRRGGQNGGKKQAASKGEKAPEAAKEARATVRAGEKRETRDTALAADAAGEEDSRPATLPHTAGDRTTGKKKSSHTKEHGRARRPRRKGSEPARQLSDVPPAPQTVTGKGTGTTATAAAEARSSKRSAALRERDDGKTASFADEGFAEDLAIDMGSDSESDEGDDTAVEALNDSDDEKIRRWRAGEVSDVTFAEDDGSGKESELSTLVKEGEIDDDYLPGDSLVDSEEERDVDELFSDEADDGRLPEIEPGYATDSSTEETTNTVGNIPMSWYDDLPHIGYDRDGKRVLKPATKDELEAFLASVDDVDGWRTVHDKLEGKDVVLTDEELDIIRRLHNQQFTDAAYDPYTPWVDFFSSKTMETPLSSGPEPKRRFIPSKWEANTVMKIVRAIRQGRIVPGRSRILPKPKFYDLWGPSGGDADAAAQKSNHPMHIPAPKVKLPDHAESYNPPPEYLLTEKELEEWKEAEPEDRERNFVPAKYDNLRSVPAYVKFINDRFERCLDLYLCPRVKKNRINIDPESLIPKLPDPRDLEPFPRHLAVTYRGHAGRIRCISVDPSGRWFATGSDDGDIRMWELATGRCIRVWHTGDEHVEAVEWCPNRDVWILAVAFGNNVALIIPPEGAEPAVAEFSEKLAAAGFALLSQQGSASTAKPTTSTWSRPTAHQEAEGWRVVIGLARGFIKQVAWHKKGDYFASVAPDAQAAAVLIHQLSKHATQSPFKKAKGLVQKVLFHPTKPLLLVATQRYVRVYNLQKQELARTLQPNCKWISSMDIHPSGDHVLVGTYYRQVVWFDLDLSSRPYKTMVHHAAAVRSVAYASRSGYPLFATASDDGSVHVFHGQVFADLLQNPLLVPVRRICNAHEVGEDKLGVLACQWHPSQPWLLTAGADGLAKLWS